MAKKILVVDDDAYIRDLYEEVLKNDGFDVTIAQDGEEGLQKMSEGGYDLVLLDVMLPKLDGLGILMKLKESPAKAPNGPIFLLTNLDNDPTINQAKELGVHTFLVKADTLPPTLLAKIHEAIA